MITCMDILHCILIFIILLIIACNNVRLIRTHYYKLFFIFTKKIYYYYKESLDKFKIEKKESILPKKFKKPVESKINNFYKKIKTDKLKIIQNKLSWN